MIGSERRLQTLQERQVQRIVTFQQVFEVDIDPLKMIRQNPSPQIGDDQILLLRVREKNVHALRVEVAHLRVAEHRNDVQIVRPGDVQSVFVVRDQDRIPVMEVEPFGVLREMHPRRHEVRHVRGVRPERVQSGLLPRRVEGGDDSAAFDGRERGAGAANFLLIGDRREKLLPLTLKQVHLQLGLVPRKADAAAQSAPNHTGDPRNTRQQWHGEEADQPHTRRHDRQKAEKSSDAFNPPPPAVRRVEENCPIRHGESR